MTDPTLAAQSAAAPRPGWYPDPAGSPAYRWWNGVGWTADLHAAPPAQPTMAPPALPPEPPPFGTYVPQPYLPPRASSGWQLPRVLVVAVVTVCVLLGLGVMSNLVFGGFRPTSQDPVVRPVVQIQGPGDAANCAGSATPSFRTTPRPPAGYEGEAEIFSSTGSSDWDSPDFALTGGAVSGGMAQCGQGAYFYLVRAGTAFDQSAKPTASCAGQCATGGWSVYGENPAAGRYHLHVVAPKGTTWTFTLSENLSLPISVKATGDKVTGTSLDAHGLGSRDSQPFTFYRSAHASAPYQIVGQFSCQLACSIYLVPASRPLDTAKDLLHASQAGESGGLVVSIPSSGTYRLEVRSGGAWQLQLPQQ